jgi:hypothetical protein
MIDVSELLVDPDFCTTATLVRRAVSVNEYGLGVYTDTELDIVCAIQPANGKDLERLPELSRFKNVIKAWSKTEFFLAGSGQYADDLIFRGKRYSAKALQEDFPDSRWHSCIFVQEDQTND